MAWDSTACSSTLPRRGYRDSIVIDFASDHTLLAGILRACCDFVADDAGNTAAPLEIVLRELLSNAIEHGNHGVRSRSVRCEVSRIGKCAVYVRVTDQGRGFRHQDLDLTPKAPGCRTHRGLALARAFCEELSFNAAGNEVTARINWDNSGNGE